MLIIGQSYLKKFCGVSTEIFLKFIWPIFNIMHERVKIRAGNKREKQLGTHSEARKKSRDYRHSYSPAGISESYRKY